MTMRNLINSAFATANTTTYQIIERVGEDEYEARSQKYRLFSQAIEARSRMGEGNYFLRITEE